MPELKPYEYKLAALLLELASNEFGNHGCNDFPLHRFLSREEMIEITRAYHEYNGDPEEFRPEDPIALDFALMGYLASKLCPPGENLGDLTDHYYRLS